MLPVSHTWRAQVQEPATTGGAAIESAGPEVAPAPSPAAVQQQTILHSVNAYGANSTVRQETYGATQISSYAQVSELNELCFKPVLAAAQLPEVCTAELQACAQCLLLVLSWAPHSCWSACALAAACSQRAAQQLCVLRATLTAQPCCTGSRGCELPQHDDPDRGR